MKELEDKKYTLSDVKEIMRAQSFEYESVLSDQKERMFALVSENNALKEEIESYKKKNDAVSEALVVAIEKSKEIERNAKKKFESNLMRLKIFEGKLANYYKRIVAKYPMDENLAHTEEFIKKMDDILSTDYLRKEYGQRMFGTGNPTAKNGDDYLKYNDETGVSGFDINEALNPSDDLESICKDLGLI